MAVQNSLQQRKPTFTTFLAGAAVKNKINSIIGGKDGQLFITAITSAVSANPALAECDNSTILSAALLGASLKLSPSPQLGQYYMVPYNDKRRGCTVAQFQLGYKGYVQLAVRSGMYKKLTVLPIKAGELVRFDPLNEDIEVNLIDDERQREEAQTIGYYAMFEYTNGFRKAMYWSHEKMMLHADKYSPAFHADAYQKLLAGEIPQKELWKYSSFWYKNFDDMACKTMLRQIISRWGIMSIELQQAITADEAVIHEDGTPEYVEDGPAAPIDTTGAVAAEDGESPKEDTPEDAAASFFDGAEQ